MPTLTLVQARRAAVIGQLLAGPRPASLLEAVAGLGRLQIDPTNVVARAERMVLWSRLGNYDVNELDRAAYQDRTLFEHWAFYLPSADYPLHRPAMRRWLSAEHSEARRARAWLAANPRFRRYLLTELRQLGPLRSRDLVDRAEVPWRSGGWNDGKNLSRMLEFLLMTGIVAVAGRDGNERLWDLAERCHPLHLSALPPAEATRRLIDRQLRARGVARPAHFGWAVGGVRPPGWDIALRALVRRGVAAPVTVADRPGTWYAHTDVLAAVLDTPFLPRTTLLSPFDRLIHERDRTEELFGFHYRLEMYVPRDKRRYGHYVLPVLDGDRLVGRVDAAVDRAAGRLRVHAIYAEPDAPADAGPRLAAVLGELGRWVGVRDVAVGTVPPVWAGAF